MSVLDFPDVNPDTGTSLSLKANTTTFTSDLNNAVQTGKLVGDQWSVNMPFTNRTEKEGRRTKAFLARLGGMAGRFRMGPPDLNQLGTMSGSGVVDGAEQQGSTLNTDGWDGGQSELFEAGDYIEFNGELKMVTDTVDTAGGEYITYTGANLMSSPFDPSGWAGATDPDLSYQSVTEQNPSGESFVGEFEYIGGGDNFGLISDTAVISSPELGYWYTCIVVSPLADQNLGLRILITNNLGSAYSDSYVNAASGLSSTAAGQVPTINFTTLSNGYSLIEVRIDFDGSVANLRSRLYFNRVSINGSYDGLPNIGDKIKCQAAFFGLSGRYQGSVSYAGTNVMPSPFDPSGWTGDPDATIQNITTQNPSGQSFIGLATAVNQASIVLNTSSDIALLTGESVYCACLIKNVDGSLLQIRYTKNGSLFSSARFNPVDGTRFSGDTQFKSTDLGNGYYLIETVITADEDATFASNLWLFGSDGSSTPDVGSQLYVQAAYFGKNNDWPATIDPADPDQWPSNYLAKASIPIAPPIRKATNDGDEIETQSPQAIFMLADDNQAAWDIQANYIHGASINCIEDVT